MLKIYRNLVHDLGILGIIVIRQFKSGFSNCDEYMLKDGVITYKELKRTIVKKEILKEIMI